MTTAPDRRRRRARNGDGPLRAATAGLTRVLMTGAALTGVALVGLASGSVVHQAAVTEAWWTSSFGLALLIAPVAVLVLAWTAPLGLLRASGYAMTVIFVTALVTLPSALHQAPLPDDVQPWMINLLPMVSLSAAIVMPAVPAWGVLVGLCALSGIARFVTDGANDASTALQDSLFNSTTIAVFVAIAMVTIAAAARRDQTAERLAIDEALRASMEAQYLQRSQVASLLHDEVISTLIAAVRSTEASAPLIRASATRALERIDALGIEDPEGMTTTLDVLTGEVRDAVASIDPEVIVRTPARGTELAVPLPVVRAIVGATAEAVRNSLRHADGTDARRTVGIDATESGVSVTIADDGPGFDPENVPRERYGLRYSILRRMSSVEGGSAEVTSERGRGTRVVVRWAGVVS